MTTSTTAVECSHEEQQETEKPHRVGPPRVPQQRTGHESRHLRI